MFIVCLGDGLGNQMFHYAFYLGLKKKYPGNRVLMNISDFYGDMNEHNGYELERIFGIHVDRCSHFDAMVLADYYPLVRKENRKINKLFAIRKKIFGPKQSYICQDDPTFFYDEIFEMNPLYSYMFRGNWINEKYFSHVKEEVKRDFCFPEFQDENNILIAEQISNCNAVAVHVRRGDYVDGGMCQLGTEYYKKACDIIEQNVESPKYFLFSDDSEYIEKELNVFGDYILVSHNRGKDSFRDMQLMSLCKHNIIANSTFSFWGAYLNKNKDKIVIAPSVACSSYRNSFACEDWIKI